jgi:hypothetical protein
MASSLYAEGEVWIPKGADGDNITVLAIDPTTPQTIYAASGNKVYVSTDGAESWSETYPPAVYQGLSSLAINPDAPMILYAGSGGGIYKSIDGGSSWDFAMEGLSNSQVVALAIDPDAQQTVYAGTYSGGVYKTTNGSDNWYPASTGLTSAYVRALAMDPLDSQIIYAGTGLGIFQSTDGGSNWSEIGYGPLADAEIDALAMDPTEPQTLYAGSNGEGLWAYSVPPEGSYFTLATNAGGASTVITPGNAQPANVGYAALRVNSGTNPYGTAVFKFKQKIGAGAPETPVTVSEAGVPSSVPTTSARLFIDFRSNIPSVPGKPGAGNVTSTRGSLLSTPHLS